MPYTLIPDGFTLKKVTKQQQDAVNRHRRHDNVKTVLNNPEIIKQLIIVIAGYYTARAGVEAIDELKKLGATIPKAVEDTYTKKRDVGAPVGVSIEDIIDFAITEITG